MKNPSSRQGTFPQPKRGRKEGRKGGGRRREKSKLARTFLMTRGPRKTTAAAAAQARRIPRAATCAHHRIARHRSTAGHSPSPSPFPASFPNPASTSSGILMYSPAPQPLVAPDIPIVVGADKGRSGDDDDHAPEGKKTRSSLPAAGSPLPRRCGWVGRRIRLELADSGGAGRLGFGSRRRGRGRGEARTRL